MYKAAKRQCIVMLQIYCIVLITHNIVNFIVRHDDFNLQRAATDIQHYKAECEFSLVDSFINF